MPNQNQNSIAWEADEFKHYPKNLGWYVVLVSLTVLVIAFFIIIESDIFAAVSLALIAVLIIIFSRQKPLRVNIELTGRGISFGNLFYPYKQIKFFWVVNNPRHRTLNFHTTAFVNNVLILELEDQDADEVRDFLIKHVPEHHETEETRIQKIMHAVKF